MSNERYQREDSNSKRRLKQARMQRQVRESQRKLNRLRIWYKFILLVLLIALGYFVLQMPQWRLPADAFDSLENPALEIVNNRIVPSQKILSALRRNQVPQDPIYLVKTDNLKKSITQLEPVQDVFIRRFWFPARLRIIILERTPIVTITPNIDVPPIAFFSAEGKLIGREYMPLDDDYDTVLVGTYGSGDDYRNWDIQKVLNFKTMATLVEAETGEKVEYIDYRDPKDVYIKIPTVNIRLGSIDADTLKKISRLPSIIPQLKMVNGPVKYIDLRWETSFIKLGD